MERTKNRAEIALPFGLGRLDNKKGLFVLCLRSQVTQNPAPDLTRDRGRGVFFRTSALHASRKGLHLLKSVQSQATVVDMPLCT